MAAVLAAVMLILVLYLVGRRRRPQAGSEGRYEPGDSGWVGDSGGGGGD